MNDYDVPLNRCRIRGCPVVFTTPSKRRRVCLMHAIDDQALTTERRAFLGEVQDLITRPPSEVRSKGRVVRG